MLTTKIANFANQLQEAEALNKATDPLTSVDPNLTAEEAYLIQLENIKRKVDQGQKIVGKKSA